MRNFLRAYPAEAKLALVLTLLFVGLSLASDSFFTASNLTSLLNNNAVNVIWATGLLVVLIAGGIDISFAVAASVVQYLCVYAFAVIGGGNWAVEFLLAMAFGIGLNLLGVSPYAFKMVVGVIILAAISLSNVDLAAMLAPKREDR